MKVATLVIHYQVDHLTDVAVGQLLAQKEKHDLYVVDCGSTKPYKNRNVSILRLPKSYGLAGSINRAMKRLEQYGYAWQYTNDVTCTPEVLASLVGRLKKNPKLAAVQPSMPSWHAHLNPRIRGGCEEAIYLEWAAVLVNMAAWRDIGPLDQGFNFFSCDIDWSWRAKQRGWKLAVDYSVRCGHPWRGTHNVTGFDIGSQAAKEHLYGMKKYGRPDWQAWLMSGGQGG